MKRLFFLPILALFGCGSRAAEWTATVDATPPTVGLSAAAVIVDDPTHRALVLTAPGPDALARTIVPIGHGFLRAERSTDGSHAFLLSAGDEPRKSERDERPSLTVIDGSTSTIGSTRFSLATPLSGMSIDPEGKWLALFAGSGTHTAFVENPNALVLVDLTAPPSDQNPIVRTIRSFGGRPQRVTFSPTVQLPGGARRLLVVESDQDVTLLDLNHLHDAQLRPELTVRLSAGADAHRVTPAGVVIDDGDPARTDDARIAVRLADDSNVVTLQLGPAPSTTKAPPGMVPNDFTPTLNLTDVGGLATDMAFVRTDGGLRIAALVPSKAAAVLVEPETSLTEDVKLPSPYQKLSLVSDVVNGAPAAGAAGTDVALLWNGGYGSGVAFWALGRTAGQPYRSVEVLALDQITSVASVPKPRPELKLLQTPTSDFYVLDLVARTAAPLETTSSTGVSLTISPDAQRIWAFVPSHNDLGEIRLSDLSPYPLLTDLPIAGVFDIARADGGRAVIALHAKGALAATVLDGEHPDSTTLRLFPALLLQDLP